jgi:hypothetical protein
MTRLPHELASPQTMHTKRRNPTRTCVVCETRAAGSGRRMCNTCRDRNWRARHPEHHLWNNLKKSAKKRGLEFKISLAWWLGFCELTGFAEMVGRTKGSASIDRVRSWEGYLETNIQILEVGANSAKGQNPPPINSEDRFYTDDENPLL